jgi:hypothetical protein
MRRAWGAVTRWQTQAGCRVCMRCPCLGQGGGCGLLGARTLLQKRERTREAGRGSGLVQRGLSDLLALLTGPPAGDSQTRWHLDGYARAAIAAAMCAASSPTPSRIPDLRL